MAVVTEGALETFACCGCQVVEGNLLLSHDLSKGTQVFMALGIALTQLKNFGFVVPDCENAHEFRVREICLLLCYTQILGKSPLS